MLNRLSDGLSFQTQALALRAERQRMLAGNIANADTPNYQARDFHFAQALQGAMGESPAAATRSHAAHLASSQGASASAQARVWALQSQTHVDSNGVDMDRERAAFVDNSLKYEATLRFVNGSVRTILDAMKSHNAG